MEALLEFFFNKHNPDGDPIEIEDLEKVIKSQEIDIRYNPKVERSFYFQTVVDKKKLKKKRYIILNEKYREENKYPSKFYLLSFELAHHVLHRNVNAKELLDICMTYPEVATTLSNEAHVFCLIGFIPDKILAKIFNDNCENGLCTCSHCMKHFVDDCINHVKDQFRNLGHPLNLTDKGEELLKERMEMRINAYLRFIQR